MDMPWWWYLLLIIAIVLIVWLVSIPIRKKQNNSVPDGGICESSFIDINGTKQWISIYGKDLRNPVLLYLHGGPGMSTSLFDYVITRKWSDVYTVVTWDQRNCGKSYCQSMDSVELSNEIVMSDAMAVINHVRQRLGKEKITLLGHSWGSLLGARLAIEHPEYFDAFIGTAQIIDLYSDEAKLFTEIEKMAQGNNDDLALIKELENSTEADSRYFEIRTRLLKKYRQDVDPKRSDFSVVRTVLLNPYYSSSEMRKSKYLKDYQKNPGNAYKLYVSDKRTNDYFTLKDVKQFPIPYYNINGDMDFIADYRLAQEFFDRLDAPAKRMYLIKGVSHGTLIERSSEFSEYIHDIAAQMCNGQK